MKTYISLFDSFDSYKKVLKSASAADQLVLLSKSNDPVIPFSMVEEFKNAKCKVEVIKMTGNGAQTDEISIAFTVGRIYGEKKDVEIIDNNPVLKKVKALVINNEKTKSVKKQSAKAPITEEKGENKHIKPEKAAETEDNTAVSEDKKKKKKTDTNRTENKQKEAETSEKTEDDKKFDDLFDKLTQTVSELKTDDFDPSSQLYNIVTAVKLMDEQKLTFEKAIKQACSPLIAEKLYASVKGKKNVILKIVREMPEEK